MVALSAIRVAGDTVMPSGWCGASLEPVCAKFGTPSGLAIWDTSFIHAWQAAISDRKELE
jgi:hypothetical protein